ncbi:MAG: type III-B CRISPR-associated protein Cas10/Cmr2 [Cyanophyceae cyanobacterium]
MFSSAASLTKIQKQTAIAITWCLLWGRNTELNDAFRKLQSLREAILNNREPDDFELREVLTQVKTLLSFSNKSFNPPKTKAELEKLVADYPYLQEAKIGLVYGGATKIKSYVFESADLQEIRGASALLDAINLVDLPAFFHGDTSGRFPQCQEASAYCHQVREWLKSNFSHFSNSNVLIPELVIYSTGGNILAFCPAAFVDHLVDAIEKRYTCETLTANSCAVRDLFCPLEIYLGKLQDSVSRTIWLDTIQEYANNPVFQAYFGISEDDDAEKIEAAFKQRKGFSELVGKLASQFNQRRSGHDSSARPSRRYPPLFETHPYLMRDDSDRRSAVVKVDADTLPNTPQLSEPTARKRRVGQIAKREASERQQWYKSANFNKSWNPTTDDKVFRSWVSKFEQFLCDEGLVEHYDKEHKLFVDGNGTIKAPDKREARSLTEIGDASDGFVAYIYADGNNMGQYIRDQIKTPAHYQEFSQDVFEATEQSVYWALAHSIAPHYYKPDAKSSRTNKAPVWIHPFEIITIGGDDVLLVVPANKALEVALKIGFKFESILMEKITGSQKRYALKQSAEVAPEQAHHRYLPASGKQSGCCLSISSGVLITAANTPIYYADKLVSQLLKSAKKRAKDLRSEDYFGGTVDFLVLKAVTMISSDISSFRNEGLTVRVPQRPQELKLYGAPYTLYELEGLIATVEALKKSGFPRSQLYQIRSLLKRGKRSAILNYRYFRVRLGQKEQELLQTNFEAAWCEAESNNGNLAPWSTAIRKENQDKTIYETIWREMVDLYPFIDVAESASADASQNTVAKSTREREEP